MFDYNRVRDSFPEQSLEILSGNGRATSRREREIWKFRILPLASIFLELPEREPAARHTLAGIYGAVFFARLPKTLDSLAAPINGSLFFCMACYEEERVQGEAVWHRRHQIFGLDRCQIHSCSLLKVPPQGVLLPSVDSVISLGKPVTGSVKDARKVRDSAEKIGRRLEAVDRFVAISEGLLASKGVPRKILSERLLKLARAQRASPWQGKKWTPLHEVIRSRFPSDWLDRHFAKPLHASQAGVGLETVDRTITDQACAVVEYYILAAAVLCDTAESALELFKPHWEMFSD